jgi:hypothetical protein
MAKNNNKTKTTKHTIEFSNNTPALQATLPLYSTWTETSNRVLQSYWPGAVGFSLKTTPLSGSTQRGPHRAPGVYAMRSISAPRLTRFSMNSG